MPEKDVLAQMPIEKMLAEVVSSFEGLVIADRDGRFIYVSKKWTELTGLTLEDVYGRYVIDITPDSRIPEVLKTEEAISGEVVRVHSKDGGDVPMISYYTPIHIDGTLAGCATVCASQGLSDVLTVSGRIDSMIDTIHYYQSELAAIQGARYSIQNIIGNSPCMQKLRADIRQCARTSSTVLIQGETGTGKELVAHSIHALSRRASSPFVKINCAAIPESLIESELFGYAPGAFTGAGKTGKKGKFQLADGGTLFLDEINSMPLSLQSKLLRAIQEREVEPVGAVAPEPVDVRIVAASNKDLRKLIKNKLFREDLYYRLNVIPITVPPLREHREDIPAIAKETLAILNEQLGMAVPGITDEANEYLKNQDWPGNVRELRNMIERAMNRAWMETLTIKHFGSLSGKPDPAPLQAASGSPLTIQQAKENAEKAAIIQALSIASDNRTQAAEILGISRAMLHRKLLKYEL